MVKATRAGIMLGDCAGRNSTAPWCFLSRDSRMAREMTDSDVLIVVDVQNDFCPGGSLAVPAGDEIVPLVNQLARRFQHVVLTQDWHPTGHSSFASANAGRKPFEVVSFPYGPQVLW